MHRMDAQTPKHSGVSAPRTARCPAEIIPTKPQLDARYPKRRIFTTVLKTRVAAVGSPAAVNCSWAAFDGPRRTGIRRRPPRALRSRRRMPDWADLPTTR